MAPAQRIKTRNGTPTPDDLDELLARVWKNPPFSSLIPRHRRLRTGSHPPWRPPSDRVAFWIALYHLARYSPRSSNKLPVDKNGITSILLLRVGEAEQGVVGLQKVGVTGEVEPGLSVRYMGTDEHSHRFSSGHPLFLNRGFDR